MSDRKSEKSKISIVLVRPKYAGNIGAVARCAVNMDIDEIIVVGKDEYDTEEMIRRGTHYAREMIESIQYASDLESALASFHYVVGTTARRGTKLSRRETITPEDMTEGLRDVMVNNDVALIFGPEDRGLTNEELAYCDTIVSIPVSKRMTSINLSHAVMILCYAIFRSCRGGKASAGPRYAAVREREAMYEDLMDILITINFINAENPDYWMVALRRFFSRTRLLSRDVQIMRGICRQIGLYGQGKTRDKRLDAKKEDTVREKENSGECL